MSEIAVRAEHLSKRYDITAAKNRQDTLVEQLTSGVRSLFQARQAQADSRAFWALQDVSFEIGKGESVAIIGKNGAGKSTLLKIISQITVPTRGRAEIYGRVGSLLEVGTGFHPELTGRENIFLNGAIIGMKKEEIRRRFDSIVEFSGVGGFLDTPVKRYSSGMHVRLGFAVAAHLEPDILLVDEVLAVGDSAFQKKCLDKIRELAAAGRTVFLISHNMVAVNSICQRVIWIKDGCVFEDGPSSEVVSRYLGESLITGDGREESWDRPGDAPGDDTVRLRRVRVLPTEADADAPLTMDTPFQVEIEYWNLLPGAQLHITLHFYTADHIIAFTTGRMNTGEPLAAGLHRATCQVPANLMNSGLHRLAVLVVKDSSTLLYTHHSGVPVNILDLRKREGFHYQREPGIVQPQLDWSTEYLGATLPSEEDFPNEKRVAAL